LKKLAINGFDILVQLPNEIAALQFGDIVFGSDIKQDKRSLDEEVYIEIEVAVAIDFIHHFSERGSSGGSTGAPTSSALGVRFPDGTRFDLGLLEALLALMAAAAVVLFSRQPRPPGQRFGFLLLLAGAARISIAGASESSLAFTTAFEGCVLAMLGGVVLVSRPRRMSLSEPRSGKIAEACPFNNSPSLAPSPAS